MRTGAKYGLLAALLALSALAWAQGDPGSVTAMSGAPSTDQLAVRLAAQYGPLAVAIVLAGLQIGRTIQATVREAVAGLRAGGVTVRVALECPHLDHLAAIQRHLDREDARREVEAGEAARLRASR